MSNKIKMSRIKSINKIQQTCNDSSENIFNDLIKKKNKYHLFSYNHKHHEKTFRKIYFIFGFPSVIFSLLVTAITGIKSLEKKNGVFRRIDFLFVCKRYQANRLYLQ